MPPFLLSWATSVKRWSWSIVAVLFVLLLIVLFYYRHKSSNLEIERDGLRGEIATAKLVNDQNMVVIQKMVRQKEIDDNLSKSLMDKIDSLITSDRARSE